MMQNTSHAVMAQRSEPSDSLDFFPTPPWATRALCEYVISISGLTVWEPACGAGHMARALKEYAGTVGATDVHDYGYGSRRDFLWRDQWMDDDDYAPVDWIITNPPFRLALQFIERGLEIAKDGVAMLVRTSFLESGERYNQLFSVKPPDIVAQFVERVPMVKGRLDKTASTATSYCWLVWYQPAIGKQTRLLWIPPCRAKLERAEDYA